MNMIDLRELKKQKESKNKESSDQNSNQKLNTISQEPLKTEPKEEKEAIILKPSPKKSKIKTFGKAFICLGVFFLIIGAVFSNNSVAEKSNQFFSKIPILGDIKHLVESSDKKLKGEEEDRINILLLGMGGESHQGGGDYLADTILLASLKPSTQEVALISVPRDLSVPIEGRGRQKINAVNAFAEREEKGSGGKATAQTLEGLLDIPIHYYARADFKGFVNIIDRLGGIDIYVEETLSDYRYPVLGRESATDYNSRYEHLHVEKGWHHMDGELALKFVRSRHGQGAQGSDFARARRQQQVLSAVKEKFESTNIVLKPSLILDVLKELDNHILTNLEIWEMIKLWEIGKGIDPANITREVLEPGNNGILRSYVSTSTGYILLPRDNNFKEIQTMVKNIFSEEEEKEEKEEKNKVSGTTLEVRNGTWINGLAGQTSLDLEKIGFTITRIGNSDKKNFQKSVIYDLTFGGKLEALEILKQEIDANVSYDIPEWLKEDIKKDVETGNIIKKPDFLLILGENASKR